MLTETHTHLRVLETSTRWDDDPIVKGLMESTETKHHHHLMLLTKLVGSSEINQHTKSGPQMSEQWVRDRINALDGAEKFKLKEALDDGDVEFVISKG